MPRKRHRCIVHLDMDAFYAQVESVRLGIDSRTQPYALEQWHNFLAVNYPAKETFRIDRMDSVWDARKKVQLQQHRWRQMQQQQQQQRPRSDTEEKVERRVERGDMNGEAGSFHQGEHPPPPPQQQQEEEEPKNENEEEEETKNDARIPPPVAGVAQTTTNHNTHSSTAATGMMTTAPLATLLYSMIPLYRAGQEAFAYYPPNPVDYPIGDILHVNHPANRRLTTTTVKPDTTPPNPSSRDSAGLAVKGGGGENSASPQDPSIGTACKASALASTPALPPPPFCAYNRTDFKVSLEPYRAASQKIFALLHSIPGVHVAKAGIDEAFLDVTEAAKEELDRVTKGSDRCCAVKDEDEEDPDPDTDSKSGPPPRWRSLGDIINAGLLDPHTVLVQDETDALNHILDPHQLNVVTAYDIPMQRFVKRRRQQERGHQPRRHGGLGGFKTAGTVVKRGEPFFTKEIDSTNAEEDDDDDEGLSVDFYFASQMRPEVVAGGWRTPTSSFAPPSITSSSTVMMPHPGMVKREDEKQQQQEEEEDHHHSDSDKEKVVGKATEDAAGTYSSSSPSGVPFGPLTSEEVEFLDYAALLAAASRVVYHIRYRLFTELHYDCSAGIAHNQLLAKILSASHKPRKQVLMWPHLSSSVIGLVRIEKIRGFGGKFGAILTHHNSQLRPVDIWHLAMLPRTAAHRPTTTGAPQRSTQSLLPPYAFYRLRGVDSNAIAPPKPPHSWSSLKEFPIPKRIQRTAQLQDWVPALCHDLWCRQRYWESHYQQAAAAGERYTRVVQIRIQQWAQQRSQRDNDDDEEEGVHDDDGDDDGEEAETEEAETDDNDGGGRRPRVAAPPWGRRRQREPSYLLFKREAALPPPEKQPVTLEALKAVAFELFHTLAPTLLHTTTTTTTTSMTSASSSSSHHRLLHPVRAMTIVFQYSKARKFQKSLLATPHAAASRHHTLLAQGFFLQQRGTAGTTTTTTKSSSATAVESRSSTPHRHHPPHHSIPSVEENEVVVIDEEDDNEGERENGEQGEAKRASTFHDTRVPPPPPPPAAAAARAVVVDNDAVGGPPPSLVVLSARGMEMMRSAMPPTTTTTTATAIPTSHRSHDSYSMATKSRPSSGGGTRLEGFFRPALAARRQTPPPQQQQQQYQQQEALDNISSTGQEVLSGEECCFPVVHSVSSVVDAEEDDDEDDDDVILIS